MRVLIFATFVIDAALTAAEPQSVDAEPSVGVRRQSLLQHTWRADSHGAQALEDEFSEVDSNPGEEAHSSLALIEEVRAVKGAANTSQDPQQCCAAAQECHQEVMATQQNCVGGANALASDLRKQLDDLQNLAKRQAQQFQAAMATNRDLQSESEQLETDLAKAEGIAKEAANAARTQLRRMRDENEEMSNELGTKKQELKELGDRIASLQGELAKLVQKVTAATAAYQQQVKALKDKLSATGAEASTMIAELKDKKSRLAEKMEKMTADYDRLRSQVDNIKAQNEALGNKMTSMKESVASAREELAGVRDKVSKALGEKGDLQAENDRLREQTRKNKESLEEAISSARADLDKRKQKLDSESTAHAQLQAANRQLREQAEKERATLQKELANTRADLDAVQASLDRAAREARDLADQNRKLREDAKKNAEEAAKNQWKQDAEALRAQNAELTKELDAAKAAASQAAALKDAAMKVARRADNLGASTEKLTDKLEEASDQSEAAQEPPLTVTG